MMLCMHAEDQSAKIRKDGIKMQCSKEKIENKRFNNRSEDQMAIEIKNRTKKLFNKVKTDD